MRLLPWIVREIFFRKASSGMLCCAVCVAAALCAASLALLRLHERDTRARLEMKEMELRDQMKRMWDEYRKITKDLGFNVLIVPRDQDLADFYAENFSSRYMPESHAAVLAGSNVATIQHILPSLMQKAFWPEKKRSVLVCGVRGELQRGMKRSASQKSPILQPVTPGTVVCGFELCRSLGLREGEAVRFHGRAFRVAKCHAQRGNRDDITLWMELGVAQELFEKKGLINAILALECRCADDKNLPNLAKIRTELASLLPGTQVVEFMSDVIARAEARHAAVQTEESALRLESAASAERMRGQRFFTGLFVTLAASVAAGFVGLFTLINVRTRMYELAILRALGFGRLALFVLFEGKLLLLGLAGAVAGVALGLATVAVVWPYLDPAAAVSLTIPPLSAAALAGCAALVTMAAGMIPVLLGIGRHPASALQGAV